MLMSHYLLFMYLLEYFKKEVLSLGDYLISVVVDILSRKKRINIISSFICQLSRQLIP